MSDDPMVEAVPLFLAGGDYIEIHHIRLSSIDIVMQSSGPECHVVVCGRNYVVNMHSTALLRAITSAVPK